MTDKTDSEKRKESDSDEPQYTVDLNGKRYSLNEAARASIERRASLEYEQNEAFSCWWKTASKQQYTENSWEENPHQQGDPVLVIETVGVMVPWERLDKLNVEMQQADPFGGMDSGGLSDSLDSGNGMQSLDPNDDSDTDTEKVIGRTHFTHTPQSYEEVPSPDGEEEDKIPPKPVEMGEDPVLVKWIPEHPDITHEWSAGEAIISVDSWVEWNVQARADQPQLSRGNNKDNSHDHWESLLNYHDCSVVGELGLSQEPGANSNSNTNSKKTDNSNSVEDMGPYSEKGGNWHI